MKPLPVMLVSLVALILGLLAIAASPSADAATVSRLSFGPGVTASWSFPGPEDSFTQIFVNGGQSTFHNAGQHGKPYSQNSVSVFIVQYSPGDPNDLGDDQARVIDGFADLNKGEPAITRGSSSATLSADISGSDCTFDYQSDGSTIGTCVDTTIAVDLSWAATGKMSTDNFPVHDFFDNCRINAHFHGTFRPATATGTIKAGGVEYTEGAPGDGQIVASSHNTSAAVGDCFGPPPPPSPGPT